MSGYRANRKMKLAIMQPYAFPYLGYFQLIKAVDRFVLYDDVTFIKQGWINRNRILVDGKPKVITIPVSGVSSNRLINHTEIHYCSACPRKLIATIKQAYRKAPYFPTAWPVLESALASEEKDLAVYIKNMLLTLVKFLGITTEIIPSSTVYHNRGLSGERRIIDICLRENASDYINAEAGQALYSADSFESCGVKLWFLQHEVRSYRQFHCDFVSRLSIIDVMMFNPAERIAALLDTYRIKSGR
jgi:WbqC-like protein family